MLQWAVGRIRKFRAPLLRTYRRIFIVIDLSKQSSPSLARHVSKGSRSHSEISRASTTHISGNIYRYRSIEAELSESRTSRFNGLSVGFRNFARLYYAHIGEYLSLSIYRSRALRVSHVTLQRPLCRIQRFPALLLRSYHRDSYSIQHTTFLLRFKPTVLPLLTANCMLHSRQGKFLL